MLAIPRTAYRSTLLLAGIGDICDLRMGETIQWRVRATSSLRQRLDDEETHGFYAKAHDSNTLRETSLCTSRKYAGHVEFPKML